RSSGALWPSCHDLRSRSVFLAASQAKRAGTVVEHVPAKCTHFADKNMLQLIDPGALSYRRNGSISTESALATVFHLLLEARLGCNLEPSPRLPENRAGMRISKFLKFKRSSSADHCRDDQAT